MKKEDKVTVIQDIKDLLNGAKVVYVADLEGLNAAKTSDFRRQAFKTDVKVKVVKNTLLQKAMEQMEVDFSEMYGSFKGNSALMIAETANAPAKLIKDFRKKDEKPALKSAYVQETFYVGDENLDALANIKSKEEMLGEIIGLLQSPIQRLVSALQNKSENASAEAKEEVVAEAPVTQTPEASAETTETAAEETKTEETPAETPATETPEASAEETETPSAE